MRAQTPLEVCKQIAREHAANTSAAIDEQRAARLAGQLEDYGKTLTQLAAANGGHTVASADEAKR